MYYASTKNNNNNIHNKNSKKYISTKFSIT